ncbi:MAG: indole-3-glycerol phosphate synthase TrpC [Oscillospiraceae bacterium]|nr:indole-3-glycerol phosphate synthase TrpC [Oscillospiraceae bacterium]
MTILDKIVEKTRVRVGCQKEKLPLKNLNPVVYEAFAFEKAIKKPGLSFICEVKKASPSKGVIAEKFPYIDIAHDYVEAGANAISVLTEPDFFLGSDEILYEISRAISRDIPLLRKDFTIDEYQIYEAAHINASAVLLIAELLDTNTLKRFIKICDGLGLCALVETRNEEQINSALEAGARIIGVNNRDLKTFEVNVETTARLREFVPDNVLYVAESGIETREDILKLGDVDAVLIGETLMRANDKQQVLNGLRGL